MATRMLPTRVLATAGILVATAAAAAPEPRPFTISDLVALDRIGDHAVSPDGKRVVFTVSALDWEANRRSTDLFIADVRASGPPRRLTAHDASDVGGTFSPDGRFVYFLSSRTGSPQVFRIAVAEGGEAEQVTRLPLEVGAFRLSHDGTRLAVAVEVFPACHDLECTKKRLGERTQRKASGLLFDRLLFRHWDAWADGRRNHVLIVPAVPGVAGAPVDVMAGVEANCPSRPFGGAADFVFTPDDRSLVLVLREGGPDEAWSTNFDLFLTPADGSARPRALTAANPAWDGAPTFSPDGKTLAYLAMSRPGYESDRRRIVLRDWSKGEAGPERALAADWDRSPEELVFSRDGRTLFATADHLGHGALFAIDVAGGRRRALIEQGHVGSPVVAGDELVCTLDHLRAPAELVRVKAGGGAVQPITQLNAARLRTVKLGEPEQFRFTGAGGDTVHAWIVKPVDFSPSRKYPIALLVHGGPQGSFGNHFHYRWNPQTYAGAGYVALMIDFHGSTGYGQAFTDAINGDWGGRPLEDLKQGLAAALKKYAFLDGDRACALGASYGGYLVNWIAGAWPDRFRCLVTHDGNLDERMAYFDTEELWFPEWEHGGTPWDRPEGYARHNPIDLVKSWKTPTLVIHGGKDFRVVDTQGMSTFTALQRRGVPSRLLYFPDENHWVLKPHNSVLWHETVLDWLGRHLAPDVAQR